MRAAPAWGAVPVLQEKILKRCGEQVAENGLERSGEVAPVNCLGCFPGVAQILDAVADSRICMKFDSLAQDFLDVVVFFEFFVVRPHVQRKLCEAVLADFS